jgi:hypothetical protein
MKRIGFAAVALVMMLISFPTRVHAQSAIVGVVKDTSDALLPGVTVEVASPALIEKIKSVVTDDHGLYRIVDLRPGVYSVTFTLGGFKTVKREGLELPTDFTATVDATLTVGALEESITVSGASPVVDTQSTAKVQVLSRELLDTIPTGRTAQGYSYLVPGITPGTPDVGGSTAMSQNPILVRGLVRKETTVMLDGIQMNGMCSDGQSQAYTNTQSYEEIVFQTSGAGADVTTPGVRQNMVPRQGGNEWHGQFSGSGARPAWQASSLTPNLAARGLQRGDELHGVSGFEGGTGGKLVRDRLWWFAAARRQTSNLVVADTFYPDGSPGINNQSVKNLSLRLTWQINKRDKFTAYTDRVDKSLSNVMSAGYDPATASVVWPGSQLYEQSQVKWTSTVTNRLLLEVGGSLYQAYYNTLQQPAVNVPYGSPEWYTTVNHTDTSRGTVWGAAPNGNYQVRNPRKFVSAIASYVTAAHNLKFGVQDNFGWYQQQYVVNGALHQVYQNGVPTAVAIYNTPVEPFWRMKASVGVFGQDSWTLRRLTVNAGLRWDYFSSELKKEVSATGRFVPERSYGPEQFPIWNTLAPRFGVVYDLFGKSKTAIKFNANRYQAGSTDGVAEDYNPMRLQSSGNTAVAWTDLNGNDVAEGVRGCVYLTPGCEINFNQLAANFGLITAGCQVVYAPGSIPCGTDQVDPNITRDGVWEYVVGVQHELLPRVAVTANLYSTRFRNSRISNNILNTFADYGPVQVVSPLDGRVVTIYNVSSAKVSQVVNLNGTDPTAKQWNTAVDFGFNARLPRGGSIFGGTSSERSIAVQCGFTDNPNRLEYCDRTKSDVPWRIQFKLAGSAPLRWGIQAGASFSTYNYLYAGGVVWQVSRTTRYASDCTGPCTPGALVNPGQTVATLNVPLASPGTILSDRINQLDFNVGKWFTMAKVRFQPEVSIFNALNNRAVYAVRSMNYGTSSFMQPSSVLQPRLMRIGLQLKW